MPHGASSSDAQKAEYTKEEEEEAGKRQLRRWDDVEEELLSSGAQKYSTKQWEKVQQHMGTDRNIKQLSDHW